jgi:hypothetical protein
MNEINGTDLRVFMNGVVIAHATSHTLSPKMDTRGTSNKDSGLYNTAAPGRLSVTAQCSGMMVYGDIEILRTAFANRAALTLDFGEAVGGAVDTSKTYATGSFYLTGLDEDAPDGDNATYSCSFEHASGFHYINAGSLTLRIAHSNCTTHSGTQGFAAALPIGGTPPYTYAWTGAITTQYITAKAAGTYTCTVTDAVAATATATVEITQP